MGCTQPGITGVACSVIAGLLLVSSLFLPYWSEITVVNNESDIASLEVAFGIWGTCVMVQNRGSLRNLFIQSNETHSQAVEATLTCASFFQEGIVGIHCEAVHGFSDGRCSRSDRSTASSLCAADEPVDMLLAAWDEDQARGTVYTSANERQQVAEWLSRFIPDMCGTPGLAIAALSGMTLVFSGFTLLLLFFGVTFDSYDSRIVHGGAMAALIVFSLQIALVGVWMLETYVLHPEGNTFGTAFYLSLASMAGHAMACVLAFRHLRFEKDTLIGLGLLEDDGESIDDIFKTKKLADDRSDESHDRPYSPRKENTFRKVEYVL